MEKIRDLFHEIGNWHNKISVCAGVTKAQLKQRFKNDSNSKDIDETIMRLTELEQYAVDADKVLNRLRDIIYCLIDPDTGKPR